MKSIKSKILPLSLVALVVVAAAVVKEIKDQREVFAATKLGAAACASLNDRGKARGSVCEKEDNGSISKVNSSGQAVMRFNIKHRGLMNASDVDYWKMSLTAGQKIMFDLVKEDNDNDGKNSANRNQKKSGSGDDQIDRIDLTLVDASENSVADNLNGGTKRKSRINTLVVSTTGDYYVKVNSGAVAEGKANRQISGDVRYQLVPKDMSNK